MFTTDLLVDFLRQSGHFHSIDPLEIAQNIVSSMDPQSVCDNLLHTQHETPFLALVIAFEHMIHSWATMILLVTVACMRHNLIVQKREPRRKAGESKLVDKMLTSRQSIQVAPPILI